MDKVTKEKRSWIMSRIRSESGIERVPQRLKGLYLRRHPKGVFGHPDFGNKTLKAALFVDGCYFHGCPEHGSIPASNTDFWANKILNNQMRDIEVTKRLLAEGWTVFRVWEHELKCSR